MTERLTDAELDSMAARYLNPEVQRLIAEVREWRARHAAGSALPEAQSDVEYLARNQGVRDGRIL